MKKIILLTALCLSAVSCVVRYGEDSGLTKYDLQRYADRIKECTVDYSITVLNALLDVNEYLKLATEEEKKESELYYKVKEAEIADHYFYNAGNVKLSFATAGSDLAAGSSSWKVASLTGLGWNYLAGAGYWDWDYYEDRVGSGCRTLTTVARIDNDKWEITVKNEKETAELLSLKIAFSPAADAQANTAGKVDYTISDLSGCVVKDDAGYYSEFQAEGDIVGAMKYHFWSGTFQRSYTGKLYFETFDNKSKRLDWCRMTLDDDSYETSQD